MSAQFEFAMHPRDETAFIEALLADSSIYLINGPRWPRQEPTLTRYLPQDGDSYFLVWPSDKAPPLTAKHVPSAGDWYCNSEHSTLQLMRSRLVGDCLTTGRVALHDFPDGFSESAEKRLKVLFNKLRRFVKSTYTNSIICWANPNLPYAPASNGRSANPSAPDMRLWVGPHALLWLQESPGHLIRPHVDSVVEGWLASRAGPNNSFKPKPLRGSA